MKKQIDINTVVNRWVVYETKDTKMVAEVTKVIKDTINNKIELWGYWGCDGAIEAEWGCNHVEKCRYATVEEINEESVRRVFAKKQRKLYEFRSGDVVTDDVYALRVLHVYEDRVAVQILNSHRTYEVVAKDLEILFFAEDMAG